jgi:hypothetical protein
MAKGKRRGRKKGKKSGRKVKRGTIFTGIDKARILGKTNKIRRLAARDREDLLKIMQLRKRINDLIGVR